jgi:hypothetical protein
MSGHRDLERRLVFFAFRLTVTGASTLFMNAISIR